MFWFLTAQGRLKHRKLRLRERIVCHQAKGVQLKTLLEAMSGCGAPQYYIDQYVHHVGETARLQQRLADLGGL